MQSVVGGLLFLKLESIEAGLTQSLKPTTPAVHSSSVDKADTLSPSAGVNVSNSQHSCSNHQWRQILREELLSLSSDPARTMPNETPASSNDKYDDIETQYRRELALIQIESLKTQTEVSSTELNELISNIAKLDPDNRTELLQILNRAMNQGEINGHL